MIPSLPSPPPLPRTHLLLSVLAIGCWAGWAGCNGDPNLVFQPSPSILIVGQRATLELAEGGDGASLVPGSMTLKDADGGLFSAASGQLTTKRVKDTDVEFTVPAGIAPGEATFEVKTSSGPAVSGKLKINRLMPMRDLAGKLWFLSLQGDAGGKMQAGQFAEIQAGMTGAGHGLVSVGYGGRLLASLAVPVRQLHLAWMGASPKISPAKLFAGEKIRDIAVTSTGMTLVASDKGTHVIEAPTSISAALVVKSTLSTGDTYAVAADRAGKGAVALGVNSSGGLQLSLITLGSDPALLGTVSLSWSLTATKPPTVAISPDGKTILVADATAGKVALVREGSPAATEQSVPAGETGAVAVAASADGKTFYVANQGTKNLSVIDVSSGVSFGSPVDLSSTADANAGKVLKVVVSANDEVVVLLEHELLLYDAAASKVSALTFPNLFKDKTSGEVGGSLAIQP